MPSAAPALGAVVIVLSLVSASPALAVAPSKAQPADVPVSTTTTAPTASTSPIVTTIGSVQGTGSATPLAGRAVTVQGVITAELPSFDGIFIQATTPSAVAGESVGVFVKTAQPNEKVGDLVTVTGIANESDGQTQIAASAIDLVTAGAGLPSPTPLPAGVTGSAREALEGMLVKPTGSYYLSSVKQAAGSLVVSAGSKTATAKRQLTIDDGFATSVKAQPFLVAGSVIKRGDKLIAPAKGTVLGQCAKGYRLEPSAPITAASPSRLKPRFVVASPRLNSPPTLP